MERLVLLRDGNSIERTDVEREIGSPPALLARATRDAEREAILRALSQAKNNPVARRAPSTDCRPSR